MKKTRSTKIWALLLSAIMLVTSIPFAAFTAFADESDAKDHYLFAYFTGNSVTGQRVRFAVSEDGYNYSALNSNAPVITQNLGTKCARDPYILEGQNGEYYLICTDMDASGDVWWDNTNSFVIWKSTDLINWTDETIIDVSAITGTSVHRAWAPQIIWSEADNKYMVYFGLAADDYKSGTTLHYMLTDNLLDQNSYSKPVPMIDTTKDSIDGDIWYDGNGTYYMYYKDESNATICYATSNDVKGPYIYQDRLFSADSGVPGLEGCNGFKKADGTFVMLADAYGDGYFIVADSNNSSYTDFTLKNSSDYKINHLSPRHGAVINITEAQYNALVAKFGASTSDSIDYTWTNDYSASQNWLWSTYTDISSHEINFKNIDVTGSVSAGNGSLALSNAGGLVRDGAVRSILVSGQFSAAFNFTLDASSPSNAPIFTVSNGTTDHIKFLADGTFIVNGITASAKASVTAGVENSYYISYNGSTTYLYQNGTLLATVDAVLPINNENDTLFAGIGYSDNAGASEYIKGTYGRVNFSVKAVGSEYNVGELYELMKQFESMLSGGALYRNMSNAYEAYVQAQKAYDAYTYGTDPDAVDIDKAASDLRIAMLSMVKWEIPTANPTSKPYFSADSKTPYKDDTSYSGSYNDLGYSNVLWGAENVSTQQQAYTTTYKNTLISTANDHRVELWYPETTLLYDGVNTPATSIMSVYTGYNNKTRYIWSICLNNQDDGLSLKQNWAVRTSAGTNDFSYAMLTADKYLATVNVTGAMSTPEGCSTDIGGKNSNTYRFGNIMQFTGTMNSDEYLRNITPNTTAFVGSVNYINQLDLTTTLAGASQIHIVNYKPLYDYVSRYNITDISNYKEGGMGDYFKYLDMVTAFDPNSYFTSSNNYTDCAEAIKAIAEQLPSNASFTADSEAYKALRTAIEKATVSNPNGCPELEKDYNSKLLTAKQAMDNVYFEEEGYKFNSVSDVSTTAEELSNATGLYADSIHIYSYVKDYTNESGEVKAQFACSSCKESYEVDIQSYNTVAMIYETLDSSKYTDEAWAIITKQKTQFDKIKNTRHVDPYDQVLDVDYATELLLNAINAPKGGNNDLEKQQFTVTYKIVVDNKPFGASSVTKYYYGQLADLQVETEGKVVSWEIQVDGSPAKVVATDAKSYPLLVQADTTVTVYVRTAEVENYVTIVDQYGKVLYSIPATVGDEIACNGNTVTVAGVAYTVPNMPYMSVTGYKINGAETASATVVAGENKIVPTYTPADGNYAITLDGTVITDSAKYDEVVTVKADDDAYGIAIKNSDNSYAVVTYGTEYTFFANRNMDFYTVVKNGAQYTINGEAVTDALTIHRLDYTLPFAYSEIACTDAAANKFTTFSSFTTEVPAEVTVLEKGTICIAPGSTIADADFEIGTAGVYQFVNANTAGSGNQYSVSMSNVAGAKYRAYVKYTYNYNGNEITAVSYGNICTAE